MITATALLAACGAASSPSPAPTLPPAVTAAPTLAPTPTQRDAAAQLAAAVETTLAAGTVSLEMAITFLGSTRIPDGTSMGGDGVLAWGDPRRIRMAMDMTALGLGKVGMIIDEPIVWVRFEGALGQQFKADGQWIKVSQASTGVLSEALRGAISGPNDSSLLLYYLLGASSDARVVGAEPGGAGGSTTRIDATVEFEKALARVPTAIRDAMVINIAAIRRQAISPIVASSTLLDEAGRVRRLQFDYTMSSVQGGGIMRMVVAFSNFGNPLDLAIPSDAEVIPVEQVRTGS